MARFLLGLVWALTAALIPATAAADERTSGKVYLPLADTQAAIDQTLARASEKGKRALIIMGAEWCHDSRALAGNLQRADIAAQVNEKFEILYVNVGFLEKNFDVNRRFGLPTIFGTPTVLAVDPSSQALLNRDSVHIWSSAANFSAEETAARLNSLPLTHPVPVDNNKNLNALLEQIATFEQQQAQRILAGFAVVGPMLAKFEHSKGESSKRAQKQFEDYWGQLRKLRSQLPKDLLALRQDARDRVAAGEQNIALELPRYAALEWELAQ